MAEPDIQRYLDDIGSQHQPQGRFMTHLTKILEKVDAAHGLAKEMPKYFFVKEAKGDQLDVVAKLVGSDRRFPPVPIPGYPPLLPDDIFRLVVLAKIAQNQWDGTNASYKKLWDDTLGDWMDATFVDNQDMTMNVNITGTVEPIMTELILAGYIIPKPMGVGMNVEIIVETTDKFTRAGSVATLDDARISCPIDYYPEYNTDTSAKAAAAMCASSGFLICGMEYPQYSMAVDHERSGAIVAANTCYAVCGIDYCRHSGVDEIGYSGIGSVANSARITIITQ